MPAPLEPEALREVQAFLARAIQRREPIEEDADLARGCAEHVTGNERLSPVDQVEIYRRQFWYRHHDSLVEDYPGLHYLLGDDEFDAFCRAYLAHYPPQSPSLRDLGVDIVRFAEGYEGFAPKHRRLLLDMIRYENAFIDVFDGPAYAPLDPQKLAALPPDALERARVVFHPLLAPLHVDYPVQRIRYAVKMDEPEVPPDPAPFDVVLFREGTVLRYEELSPRAFALLQALRRGVPLAPACGELVAGLSDPEAEALSIEVGAWFQAWAAWGWIVDLEVAP